VPLLPERGDTVRGMSQQIVERVPPPLVADETTMLAAWLDYHRETLAQTDSGVDPARIREAAVAPSTLSLLGLVRHMADNERYWFREVVAGERVQEYWAVDDDGDEDLLGAHPGARSLRRPAADRPGRRDALLTGPRGSIGPCDSAVPTPFSSQAPRCSCSPRARAR
jgi:hypothetical protein